ncbi:MAG: hypothetical protein QNK40_14060 [Desulfobacterales bacterium]|nr:hypothetical protein [Desulfobacterales bacterium]
MNKATSIFILICMTLLCVVGYAQADNVRPAYLGIENFKEGRYKITWKNPLKNGVQLPIAPVLPASFKKISPRTVTKTGDAVIHKWMVSSEGQVLDGQKISINGLEATVSDVLLRIKFSDGKIFRSVLRPNEPEVMVQSTQKNQTAQISLPFKIIQSINSWRLFILLGFVGMLGIFPTVQKRGIVLCSTALILGSVCGYLAGNAPVQKVFAFNQSIPSEEKSSQILQGLLLNMYRSFGYDNEEAVYDQMSKSVSGDLLTEVYLQNRNVMRIDKEDQAKVYIDRLDIREIDSLSAVEEGGFSALVRWDVYGSVNHWEHIHYRCNSYKAKIKLMPKGKYWIITYFGLIDEERII